MQSMYFVIYSYLCDVFQNAASEKEKFVKTEMERLEQRNKDLTNQNKLLHEQMEKVTVIAFDFYLHT